VRVGYGATIRYGKSASDADLTQYDIEEAKIARRWLKKVGKLQTVLDEDLETPMYKHGLIVTSQGENPSAVVSRRLPDGSAILIQDPLRLFRTTGIIALPTRMLIRLLATAEDVTHS
jgi:hypothetical protein